MSERMSLEGGGRSIGFGKNAEAKKLMSKPVSKNAHEKDGED
jgi:hypothetical protein